MPRRLKVLMSAYACEPNKGSEPADGWNWALQMSRRHEVWVLTRANNRANIEKETLAGEQHHLHWRYYDLPRWTSFWKRGSRGIQQYYYLWQMAAWRVGRASIAKSASTCCTTLHLASTGCRVTLVCCRSKPSSAPWVGGIHSRGTGGRVWPPGALV